VYVNPTQVCVNCTQVCVNRTQVYVNPTQVYVNRTQVYVNLTQVCVNPTQVCVNRTQECVNLTQVCLLAASPLAAGLFDSVVIASGPCHGLKEVRSDEKVANRDVRIRALGDREWLLNDGQIQNPSAQI
jgi:hypothetical protein